MLLEETVAQWKDEIAILKGENPRPRMKPSTLTKDTLAGDDQPRRDHRGAAGKQPKGLEIHEPRLLEPIQLPVGAGFKG